MLEAYLSLKEAADVGKINWCKIIASAPVVTHFLYAYDSFLFYKVKKEETLEIKSILAKYKKNLGQAINLQKSGILFSANVRRDKQLEIKEILGVQNDLIRVTT